MDLKSRFWICAFETVCTHCGSYKYEKDISTEYEGNQEYDRLFVYYTQV